MQDRVRRRNGDPRAKGEAMATDPVLKIGVIGAGVAALCCFTPLLVIALGALGLGAAMVWLDVVLPPMLAFFLLLTGYALWRRRKSLQ